MQLKINGCLLNVKDLGPRDAPLVIAHHGGGGIGSLREPEDTFGPLADEYRVIVFDARGCGQSEAVPPYSHAQWAADVDALREWAGAERVTVAGGSYGGFISLEYALAYPDRVEAIMLRDTAADGSNLEIAFETARNQDRIEINWENFNRYWTGQIRDDADLKQCWSEMIGLYDHDYDPERSARAVEEGSYRHEAHNWCFQHNWDNYDLKDRLGTISAPTLVTVGRHDWITPVSCSQTIADLVPNSELVIFEESGHSPQKEEYERFQQVIRDFMRRFVPVGARA
jgi:proline iminopeptidase